MAGQSLIRRPSAEYNLAEHCNLRCAACDHASPLLPRKLADLGGFRQDLEVLAGVLHLDEFRLVGGEPLLHWQVEEFVRAARESGIAEKITLYTNGVLLPRAKRSFFAQIDKLFVSVYPGIRSEVDLGEIECLSREHGFELEVRHMGKFRLTLINTPHDDPSRVRRIYGECHLAESCHTIYEGRYYKCSPAPFLEPRLALKGLRVTNRNVDSVRIHGNPDLRQDLERYLASPEPLAACSWCLGTSGVEIEHRQLDKRGVEETIYCDHEAPGELLADVSPARVR